MKTLRTLVILARSLVVLTAAMAGAAMVDSLLTDNWQTMAASISRTN